MSEELYKAIALNRYGYVVAPAGCGKTEAIVKAVSENCNDKQLILTHTNAGVGALIKRFKKYETQSSKFHVETISGWALNWVKRYPKLSDYKGTLPLPQNNEWDFVYAAATNLLDKEFVKEVIQNSYSGIIVDEYQDCTVLMHNLILQLKSILPCRILGDPLQGIFGFNEALVDWPSVERDFITNLGELNTPYRWINSQNEALGSWLIEARKSFVQNSKPNFRGSPITYERVDPAMKNTRLQQLCIQLEGSLCVIGPKHGNISSALATTLINKGLRWIEPNDLPILKKLLTIISSDTSKTNKGKAAIEFIESSHASLGDKKSFVRDVLAGKLSRPRDELKKTIYQEHSNGFSNELLEKLLVYLSVVGIKCKKLESVECLLRILGLHKESNASLLSLFEKELLKRKFNGTRRPRRCIGTTLLLKGLEFDHAIVLYNPEEEAWSNLKDLYVAITRGSKSVYIIE